MNHPSELDPLPGLPPELAELDAELARFTAAERSSFAPELEAELEGEWSRGARMPLRGPVRRAVAATVVGLTLTGLAVPPARASIVDGLQRLIVSLQEPETAPAPPQVEATPPVVTLPVDAAEADDPGIPAPPPPAVSEAASDAELPAFRPARVTYPTLVDEGAERDLIRRHYPPALQRAGVGGTVRLLLWVGQDGTVDNVQTRSNSGVPALDRAAMQGASSLRFHPATRDGQPVGTYVEFDVVFEPLEQAWEPPEVVPVADPDVPSDLAYELSEDGPLTVAIPAPIQMEARELLGRALGATEAAVEARLGSLEGLLAGDPPRGVSPLRWRSEAVTALERARARDPDNPAPALALARIRRKQGLREEARDLLAVGLERAETGSRTISPRLVAEMNFELGSIVRESWLARSGLGDVPAEELERLSCTRRGVGGTGVETLLAWNYVCPGELGAVLTRSFVPSDEGERERRAMLERFQAAVDGFPGHVGANVAILLDAADRELWLDVLNGARRFAWSTQGHPYGFLLSGLALQRLGRAEEALEDFQQAFRVLGEETEADFRAVAVLGGEDGADPAGFWNGLDPILHTEVNEREVEHLARAAYAYLRFGDLTSDAARLWLRYGRPLTVRTFGRADLRTEFWDYGQGPDVTLSRPASSDERTFTREADAYLEDLASVFPHWYGTRARPLYSLPVQAARFRGPEPGTAELEVQLDVPPALETFEGDSLDLGLFLLAADGASVSTTTRRIAGDQVRLRTALVPGVAGVVVELYNRRTHEAAALRMPALRDEDRGEDPRISDLMLVEALDAGAGSISRADPRVEPLARTDVVTDREVGLLFELYGLPEGGDGYYRLGVELVSETTGRVRPISFRPGGQTLFGTEWTRRPAVRDGAATEYHTLDLSGVEPGRYTLRATVTLPDGSGFVEERSGLGVRTPGTAPDDEPRPGGLEAGLDLD